MDLVLFYPHTMAFQQIISQNKLSSHKLRVQIKLIVTKIVAFLQFLAKIYNSYFLNNARAKDKRNLWTSGKATLSK